MQESEKLSVFLSVYFKTCDLIVGLCFINRQVLLQIKNTFKG